jgi:Ni,Fe-hydrogenase III component G
VETGEILSKLKAAVPGSVLEKSRFGRSAHLAVWVETRSLPEVAAFLSQDPEVALDWLENLSAIELDKAIVLTYFLRSSSRAEKADALILRCSLEPSAPAKEVELPSVARSWAMAAPFEAEIQEMFGVRFLGRDGKPAHAGPGLLPKGWHGFPLRKTYVFPAEFLGIPHLRRPMPPEGNA